MKSIVKTITPTIAKEMLLRNNGNRNISESHVLFLSKQMKENNWIFDGAPIRFNCDGCLLDGQHRLSAIVHSNIPQETLVVTGIDKSAFKVMDTGRNRTASDVFSISGVQYSSLTSSTTRLIININEGKYYKSGTGNKLSNSETLDYFLDNPKIQEFAVLGAKLSKQFNRVLPAATVAACYYLMAEKNIIDAEIFWSKLCTGLGLDKGSPVRALRDRLISDKISLTTMPQTAKLHLIFKAWNHERKQNTIKNLRISNNEKFPSLI